MAVSVNLEATEGQNRCISVRKAVIWLRCGRLCRIDGKGERVAGVFSVNEEDHGEKTGHGSYLIVA
jgi:hypothetical protein